MRRIPLRIAALATVAAAISAQPVPAQPARADWRPIPADRLSALKREALADVDARATFTQQMVDQVFSFGELGFQEVETSKYLVGVLRENGFTVETGVGGMPTAWVARWGSGRPVITLGSDIDGIPQASQYPGVACHAPIVAGAPGHGEGHNSGQAVNITAALAVKKIMERDDLPGTLVLWPGVAEELVAGKAYLVTAGVFEDADMALFSHVGSNLGVSWGAAGGTGLVSVLYTFEGQAAHSAGSPWRGRSALDAVELMNVGWNYRREHLRINSRSHYVVRDGGDQPNVVPTTASVWYYFRETTAPLIRSMWATGDSVARGAALMSGTKLTGTRLLGQAWPRHFNRPIAEDVYANILLVGLPEWSEADQTFAKAVQKEMGADEPRGMSTELDSINGPVPFNRNYGGGSDDIGDVSWNVPTVTLRYPANIPGLPGHHWSSSIAMATPIAHKGSTAGAKVMAATLIDILGKPALTDSAWSYFTNVQTKDQQYEPFNRPGDRPAIELNADILGEYREKMRPFYYDPSRGTYMEQLGVSYPTVRGADGSCPVPNAVP